MEDRPHRLHPIGVYMSESERARSTLRDYRSRKTGIISDIVTAAFVVVCSTLLVISGYVAGEKNCERKQHESEASNAMPVVRK